MEHLTIEYQRDLDASGLLCPLPLLRLKKILNDMDCGEVVRVTATDPASVLDFGVYIEQAGHALLSRTETAGIFWYWIRKG